VERDAPARVSAAMRLRPPAVGIVTCLVALLVQALEAPEVERLDHL